MVKRSKKCKTLNKLEMYLNEVLANPRNHRGDFKILDNALENLYTGSKDASENMRELYNDAVSTRKYKDLKLLISEWLASRVSKETVVATIIIADEQNDMKLKVKALSFIQNNIDTLECKQWENLHNYKQLKDDIYKALLVSLFKKNTELAQKVCEIEIDLDKTDEYEFPIKRLCREEEPLFKQSLIEEPLIEPSLIIEEASIEESFIGELTIEESFIGELSIEESSIEKASIEESTIEEPSIEEPTIEEPSIGKPTIEEPSIEEPTIEEPSIEEPTIEEPSIKESFIAELSTDQSITEELSINDLLIQQLPIEKQSMKEETNDNLPSTSSKGSTKSAITAEMSEEIEIRKVKPRVNNSHMINIGVLNHSDESGFKSYVAIKLSEDELNQKTIKKPFTCDEIISSENLYTSYNCHFIPIKITRLLYIKKIDVNSIEKHAFNDKRTDNVVQCFPTQFSPKFNMKLPISEGNSSQSLCSDFTEFVINSCGHNLVTTCKSCIENAEIKKKLEEDELKIVVDKNLSPIEMFVKNKADKKNCKTDVSSWVEKTAQLKEEKRIINQKYDDLVARVALAKDKWNEPEQDDKDFFSSKLDKAFNELITVKSNISRQMPVVLNKNVVYNSFEALKQKAERRFEMLHKGIHIPAKFVFDAIPITNPIIIDEPVDEKVEVASNVKFFPQNKNVKFFKSNQNSFPNQRRNNSTGQQSNNSTGQQSTNSTGQHIYFS